MTVLDNKKLIITPASFFKVMALKDAIVKSLKESGIKVDLGSIDINPDNLEKMQVGDVGWLVEPILTLATDANIRGHLFECAKSALFGNDKIDADFFENPENRKYYYPIMAEVIKINIAPFFGLASSLFAKFGKMKDKFLASK